MVEQKEIILPSFGRGFHLISNIIENNLSDLPNAGILQVFIKHTSAGLTINENADPSVRIDFETIFNKLVPENSRDYVHVFEGKDDMPAHLKSSLTGHSVTIPIVNGRLGLGIWQGIYLCEFRYRGGRRKLLLTVIS